MRTHVLNFLQANAARKLLKKPSVLEGELEPGLTLWCYCCQEEVRKHASDGLISVEWGGMLEHMARYDVFVFFSAFVWK